MLKCVPRSVKNTRNGELRYYLAVKYSGTVDRDQLCKLISAKTTVTRADVLCALVALEECIAEKLANSCGVRLGHLGSFTSAIKSTEGEEDKSGVGVKNIRRVRVVFRPSSEMKQALQDEAQLERVD